jgi:hypothetical protein
MKKWGDGILAPCCFAQAFDVTSLTCQLVIDGIKGRAGKGALEALPGRVAAVVRKYCDDLGSGAGHYFIFRLPIGGSRSQ